MLYSSSSQSSSSPSWKLVLGTVLAMVNLATAHFQIQYPSWRGNSLKDDMQWKYPCAGVPSGGNRTNWPIRGGSISVIPGWNAGHPSAFFYVNMGYGNEPPNMTNIMLPVFQMTGPSKDPYPGSFCLTQVPLPVNASLKVGDNATIQVIQVALHGASLYNCADVTLVDPADADPIPDGMCQNSSTFGFNLVYTTHSGATSSLVDIRTLSMVLLGWMVLGYFL